MSVRFECKANQGILLLLLYLLVSFVTLFNSYMDADENRPKSVPLSPPPLISHTKVSNANDPRFAILLTVRHSV